MYGDIYFFLKSGFPAFVEKLVLSYKCTLVSAWVGWLEMKNSLPIRQSRLLFSARVP